jgi:2-keto-3-deoxy-6-phosphogluconate aldolase
MGANAVKVFPVQALGGMDYIGLAEKVKKQP